MCHLRHRLGIFYFVEKLCSVLRIFKFYHSMIYQICDMMSIRTWVRVHFWIYLLKHTTHHITKLGQLKDINKGNNFQESFEQFGGLGLSSRSFFNLVTCSNYSITNCQDSSISVFQCYLELVSSLQHWVKNMFKMFVIQHTSIWSNFILMLLRIQKK